MVSADRRDRRETRELARWTQISRMIKDVIMYNNDQVGPASDRDMKSKVSSPRLMAAARVFTPCGSWIKVRWRA